jgi:thymidylate synthase (FAD)
VWRLQSQDNKQASEGALDAESSVALTEALAQHYEASFQLYKDALEKGVAREIARMFLPGFALYSTGIVKFDARNLMHFLSLRMVEDAQYEIRQFANAMWEFFEAALPWCAEAYQEYRGL